MKLGEAMSYSLPKAILRGMIPSGANASGARYNATRMISQVPLKDLQYKDLDNAEVIQSP